MPIRNVQLPERSDEFLETALRSGRFSNASEIVIEGLRLLEERGAQESDPSDAEKLEWLRAALQEGFEEIDRGECTTLRSPDEITAFVQQLASGTPQSEP
jgi:antitoxin ParD1/3/4